MHIGTYRGVVVGSLLSSFLFGFHLPALHNMIEHGAAPRWDILTVTTLFVIGTIAGAWTLLRAPNAPGRR
jgi:uncharacterized membrane protein YqjE